MGPTQWDQWDQGRPPIAWQPNPPTRKFEVPILCLNCVVVMIVDGSLRFISSVSFPDRNSLHWPRDTTWSNWKLIWHLSINLKPVNRNQNIRFTHSQLLTILLQFKPCFPNKMKMLHEVLSLKYLHSKLSMKMWAFHQNVRFPKCFPLLDLISLWHNFICNIFLSTRGCHRVTSCSLQFRDQARLSETEDN